MKKHDFYLILAVCAAIGAAFLFYFLQPAGGDTVVIHKDGAVFSVRSLSEDAVIDVGSKNTVVIENGEVFMKSADCPDRLCIRQGRISDSRREIVCLPNRVTVSISGQSEVDSVSR